MKHLTVETFMSWENEGSVWNPETKKYENDRVRAIALCDPTGYFDVAINCLRDGDMGEKDENGVYPRTWAGDYIDCYGTERDTLRPATPQEVELYLKYCPVGNAYTYPYERPVAWVTDADATRVVYARRGWLMRNVLLAWQWLSSRPANLRRRLWWMHYRWQHRNDRPAPVSNKAADALTAELQLREQMLKQRIVIRNEEALCEKIAYYIHELGSAYTLEQCRHHLREAGYTLPCDTEFGFSVSDEWPQKCHTFRKVSDTADVAEYEYIGISKM